MKLLTQRLMLVWIALIASLLMSSVGIAACKDTPLLLQKRADGTLTEKESARLTSVMKWHLENADRFAKQRKDYLDSVANAKLGPEELLRQKELFFNQSATFLQSTLEAYASLNDGVYPYSLAPLVCSHMITELPLNPFTGEPFEQKGLGILARGEDSGVAYVPEYVRENGTPVVVGYWLVFVSREICRLDQDFQPPSPAKPLPGNWALPPDTALLLESHLPN